MVGVIEVSVACYAKLEPEIVLADGRRVRARCGNVIVSVSRQGDDIVAIASTEEGEFIAGTRAAVKGPRKAWAASWLCLELPSAAVWLGVRNPTLEVCADKLCRLIEYIAMEKWDGTSRECIELRKRCDERGGQACMEYYENCVG